MVEGLQRIFLGYDDKVIELACNLFHRILLTCILT